MSDDCTIVGRVEKSPIVSPPLKKLKQSRLPFSPINTKSSKQSGCSANEKKRKLSGSDESNVPKTPRTKSENKQASTPTVDENQVTTVKVESSEEIKVEEVVSKKKGGRPAGAKNKPKLSGAGLSSPQGDGKKNLTLKDDGSPVVKKRERSVGGQKSSSSELDKSVDHNESAQNGDDKPTIDEKKSDDCSQTTKSENDQSSKKKSESTTSEKDDEEKKVSDEMESHESSQVGNIENNDEKSDESSGEENENEEVTNEKKAGMSSQNKDCDNEKSNTDKKSNELSVDGKSEGNIKKRGRPKGAPNKLHTPQDEDTPRRKRGRPAGSKNIHRDGSRTSLNNSMCSNTSDEESGSSIGNTPFVSLKRKACPVEKTRKLLSLFARKDEDDQTDVSSIVHLSSKKTEEERGRDKDDEKNKNSDGKSVTTKDTCDISEERNVNNTGSDDKEINKNETEKAVTTCEERTAKKIEINDKVVDESKESKTQNNEEKTVDSIGSGSEGSDKEIKENIKDSGEKPNEESTLNKEESDRESTKKSLESKETPNDKRTVQNDEKEKVNCGDKIKKSKTENKKTTLKDKETEAKKDSEREFEENEKENEESFTEEKRVNSEESEAEKDTEMEIKKNEEKKTNNLESEAEKAVDKEVKNETALKNEETNESQKNIEDKNDKSNKLEKKEDETKDNLEESVSDVETSICDSEDNTSKTTSPGSSSDANKSPSVARMTARTPTSANKSSSVAGMTAKTPTSAGPKTCLFMKPKKLTPKQKLKEAERLLKMVEREKQKQEREKQLQEKMAEKERLKKQKEEERKQKEEERKQKEEEKKQKEEERKQKEEEKQKQKEELRKKRQEEIDAKKKQKEEKLKKELEEKEEKQKEQEKKEEEKRKQKDKLKNKFASFFVAKKREAEDEAKDNEGYFQDFRVREGMRLAPVVRLKLSECQVSELDEYVAGKQESPSKTYLQVLKSESYIKQKSERTWPFAKKRDQTDDDDDVMVIDEDEEEDMDMGDINAMIQDPAANMVEGNCHKAKLLSFCENRRPAYWGTWSKKSTAVSARRPLAREEIFDYEYDSDDDWEEEEAGESLSDSEGDDKDDKEEGGEGGDQYEVDNDFFVPHGYLSDDEGKSDQEDDDETEETNKSETEHSRNTEQLKLKQAEFEEEMKKKTKELKPRVIGCLWMADKNNNKAYDQLMKILGPYKAVTLCSQLPIGCRSRHSISKESKETGPDGDTPSDYYSSKKFVKTFPEEAVPTLIKLIHGNPHAKSKLCREFCDYWRKFTGGELKEDTINSAPNTTSIGVSESVLISRKKTEDKIHELGHWKRCLDETKSRHIMCWYVPKKTREEYGMSDMNLTNSWVYIHKITREKKEVLDNDETTPKVGKLRPITAFAKKIPSTPSSTNTSPTSTPGTTPQENQPLKADSSLSAISTDTPIKTPSSSSNKKLSFMSTPPSATLDTPRGKQQSITGGLSVKKKIKLLPGKSQEANGPQKGSIVSFFKKGRECATQPTKDKGDATTKDKEDATVKDKGDATTKGVSLIPEKDDIIVLD